MNKHESYCFCFYVHTHCDVSQMQIWSFIVDRVDDDIKWHSHGFMYSVTNRYHKVVSCGLHLVMSALDVVDVTCPEVLQTEGSY